MKRTTKYVALDVHQATTVASVREEGGRVLARAVFPTKESKMGSRVRSDFPETPQGGRLETITL